MSKDSRTVYFTSASGATLVWEAPEDVVIVETGGNGYLSSDPDLLATYFQTADEVREDLLMNDWVQLKVQMTIPKGTKLYFASRSAGSTGFLTVFPAEANT